jgi:hypothetical protein
VICGEILVAVTALVAVEAAIFYVHNTTEGIRLRNEAAQGLEYISKRVLDKVDDLNKQIKQVNNGEKVPNPPTKCGILCKTIILTIGTAFACADIFGKECAMAFSYLDPILNTKPESLPTIKTPSQTCPPPHLTCSDVPTTTPTDTPPPPTNTPYVPPSSPVPSNPYHNHPIPI